jgi:predicted nucleotidyltransferase
MTISLQLDTIQYPQNPKWLKEHVIFLTLSGSHLYGTNVEGSDIDIKGVATLPGSVVFGFAEKFEQAQTKEPYDTEIFSVIKFVKLAYDNNPNILELLFVDNSSILLTTPQWETLRAIKHAFLSKRIASTFCGYAKGQLHKIRTHRGYLLSPHKEPPTREEFGLPARALVPKLQAADAAVTKLLDSIAGEFAVDKSEQIKMYEGAAKTLGFDSNFIDLLYREKRYAIKKAEHEAYNNWAKSRNPKRKVLEEKCGYDSKHLMQLVKLYEQCLECLDTGTLTVKRPNAKELIEIRQGSWPFEKIEAWSSDAESLILLALKKTKLPSSPNIDLINNTLQKIVREAACT